MAQARAMGTAVQRQSQPPQRPPQVARSAGVLSVGTSDHETLPDAVAITRFGHDFTRVRVHPEPPAGAPSKPRLQRKCACDSHATAGGGCSACDKEKRSGLQTKLAVNEPGDVYEREADRVADQVMATPAHLLVGGAPPQIQRFTAQPAGSTPTAPASVDRVLASSGQPLEPALRQDMEGRFGHDFSRVRVHSGDAAAASAEEVNSHAYTVGSNIVFGAGAYAPGSQRGRRLIAHELTHVVQQSRTVALQRENKDDDFIIDRKAMEHLESLLTRLYGALPRDERIKLKSDGTVAIGLITKKGGNLNKPIYVYTTNNNVASPAFRQAAESVGLRQIWGDAGLAQERSGPPRLHPPTAGPPPGKGGIAHAEQLMIGHANDHGYVVHGMAVSRRLCHDCPLVIPGHKGGRIMVTVIPDPDKTLPNPRAGGSGGDKPAKAQSDDDPPAGKKPVDPPAPKKSDQPPAGKTADPPPAKKADPPPAKKDDPPTAKKTDPPAAKKSDPPPAGKTAEPPPAKKAADPPPAKKTDPPPPKKAADPPPAKKADPPPAKKADPPPAKKTDVAPSSSSGSATAAVSPAVKTAQRMFTGYVNHASNKLMQTAAQNPKDKEMAEAIKDINDLLDAHSFIQNPTQFAAGKIADWMINRAFGRFQRQLAADEARFFATYPDVASFHQQSLGRGMSLKELQTRYDQAVRDLRRPSAAKDLCGGFVMLGAEEQEPEKKRNLRKQMIDACLATQPGFGHFVKEFDEARRRLAWGLMIVRTGMEGLRQQHAELPEGFADEIRRRADALDEVARTLADYAKQIEILIALPGVSLAVYMFQTLSGGFSGLANGLRSFGRRAAARQDEYKQEIARLDTRSDRLAKLQGAVDAMMPSQSGP